MAALVAAIFTAMAMPVALGRSTPKATWDRTTFPSILLRALPGHRQRLRLVPEPVLRLLRVRPLNPAPLAGTVPPNAAHDFGGHCTWSCCLVRAWSRPCLRELASKMRPSFVIMAWFYARPPCKQGRSHGYTVFGSLGAGISKTGTTPHRACPSLSGSMRQFVTPQVWKQFKHAAKQHGCRDRTRWTLQPLILIAAIMTWCAGETGPRPDRFVLSRAFYVQNSCPQATATSARQFSGFCEAMLRLPMPVWWAF